MDFNPNWNFLLIDSRGKQGALLGNSCSYLYVSNHVWCLFPCSEQTQGVLYRGTKNSFEQIISMGVFYEKTKKHFYFIPSFFRSPSFRYGGGAVVANNSTKTFSLYDRYRAWKYNKFIFYLWR